MHKIFNAIIMKIGKDICYKSILTFKFFGKEKLCSYCIVLCIAILTALSSPERL